MPQPPPTFRALLKPPAVAEALGISRTTLRRLSAGDGGLRPIRISDRRLAYRPEDLEAYLAARRAKTR